MQDDCIIPSAVLETIQPVSIDAFLSAFHLGSEKVYFRTFSDHVADGKKDLGRNSKSGIPITDYCLAGLQRDNGYARGIFFVVNAGGQSDKTITRVTAQFYECDDKSFDEQFEQIRAFPVKPSIIVKTRKSLHVYFLMRDAEVSRFRGIQKQLIAHFKGDPTCVNESRVMRVPGFNHCKADPIMVECLEFNPERVYTQDELVKHLPTIEPEWRPPNTTKVAGVSLERVPEGGRNSFLFRELSSQRAKGKTATELQGIAVIMNDSRCNPPLSTGEVLAVVHSVCRYNPGAIPNEWKPGTYPYRLTDVGNAEMLSGRLRGIFIHVPERSRSAAPAWLFFNGQYWEQDKQGGLTQAVIRCIREAQQMALQIEDDDKRTKTVKWLLECEKLTRLEAAMTLLKTQPGMTRSITDFDRDDMVFSVQNGVIDLMTGLLKPHRSEDLITKCSPIHYEQAAKSVLWEQFINEIFLNDQEQIQYVQKLMGYCLCGNISEESLYIFKGTGGNGKTKLVETLKYVMGPYCLTANPETLMAMNTERIPTDIARLQGARLVLMSEPDPGQKFSDNAVKKLTGGDTINARFLYGDEFEFRMQAKIIILTNHEIRVVGTDNGMWRRLVTVPFNYQVPDHKRDFHLQEKLFAEGSAVLAWMVEGCLKYQHDGLLVTQDMENTKKQYKISQDSIAQFIEDDCIQKPTSITMKSVLYSQFTVWCKANGEYLISQRAFSQRLSEKGYKEERITGGVRCWVGIAIVQANI